MQSWASYNRDTSYPFFSFCKAKFVVVIARQKRPGYAAWTPLAEVMHREQSFEQESTACARSTWRKKRKTPPPVSLFGPFPMYHAHVICSSAPRGFYKAKLEKIDGIPRSANRALDVTT